MVATRREPLGSETEEKGEEVEDESEEAEEERDVDEESPDGGGNDGDDQDQSVKQESVEMPPFVGDFDSWDKFQEGLDEYMRTTHQLLVKRSSESCQNRNVQVKKSKAYKSGLRGMCSCLFYIPFVVVHGSDECTRKCRCRCSSFVPVGMGVHEENFCVYSRAEARFKKQREASESVETVPRMQLSTLRCSDVDSGREKVMKDNCI